MAADPRVSEGARLERKALGAYLRREIKKASCSCLIDALDWLMKRHKRYDKKKGGLGK